MSVIKTEQLAIIFGTAARVHYIVRQSSKSWLKSTNCRQPYFGVILYFPPQTVPSSLVGPYDLPLLYFSLVPPLGSTLFRIVTQFTNQLDCLYLIDLFCKVLFHLLISSIIGISTKNRCGMDKWLIIIIYVCQCYRNNSYVKIWY